MFKNEEGYDDPELIRTQGVVMEHCGSNRLHQAHERSWHQTDPERKTDGLVRVTRCQGTARLISTER